MAKVYILPVGDLDEAIVVRLSCCLEERFLFQFKALPAVSVPAEAYNAVKKKYFSGAISERLRRFIPRDARYLLAITNVDIYDASPAMVSGQQIVEEKAALISLQRLRPDFYGDQNNHDILFQRLLKECTHELAHLMGSRHCFNTGCVMYFSYNLADTDRKGSYFCQDCEKRLRRLLQNY